jgi:hypothetical protein
VASLRLTIACAALLASLGGALAGCGSSPTSGTAADPAGAVPASAPLYAGATVRPSGSEQAAALAAGRALTHQADPYLRLLAALQTPGSPQLDFKRDVSPWLGPHAGVFLTSLSSASRVLPLMAEGLLGASKSGAFPFGAGGAQGAIVMDTSDARKARAFLDTQAARAGAHAASYRGIPYELTSGGIAFGLVDRFAVIGSESGLRSVIDTTLGGGSLASSSGYSKLLAAAPPDALAHLYTNPASSAQSGTAEKLSGLLGVITGARAADISLVPSTSSLALDLDTLASGSSAEAGGLLSYDPQAAGALGELPAESWLAIGLGHVGSTLERDAQDLQGLAGLTGSGQESSSSLSLTSILGGLTTPLKLLGAGSAQARRDFASWMGSAGIFASGASLLELKGAVVIASTNPSLSHAAVAELAAQLSRAGASVSPVSIPGTDAAVSARLNGLPVALDIADGRDSSGQTKFVLGLGTASVQSALDPPSTLSAAAASATATSALGEGIQPSVIFDAPTLLSLLEGVGLTEGPIISKFVPYLRSVTTLTGGGRQLGGEVQRFRLLLGLQQPAG